jgi:hypothetical protein
MGTMSLKELAILLLSAALFGCTPTPPPAQKQPTPEEAKKPNQKDDNIHIPHTGWAP